MHILHHWKNGLFLPFVATLALDAGDSRAILTYQIFQDGNNVVIQASGSLVLPDPYNFGPPCGDGTAPGIKPASVTICTGEPRPERDPIQYDVVGPFSIGGTSTLSFEADSSSGMHTYLANNIRFFGIDASYVSGDPILSNAMFSNRTLFDLGLSAGSSGTWNIIEFDLEGVASYGDIVRVCVGDNPCFEDSVPVPGPLPVFGAAAAFGWSRSLRRRIRLFNGRFPQA